MLNPLFKFWLPVLAYAVLIFGISSIPGSNIPSAFPYADYIFHIIEYFVFGFLICLAIKNTKTGLSLKKVFLFGIILVMLYAATDEFHQSFVPGRDASFLDWLCDSAGAMGGIILAL
ncbi:MAG: VanZ family protein [Candidatus Omnitrophica bacterium]|nr:VanZ family protein [Candidatus Omnitrophota bacterium]MDD5549774.1 VanZ family protein [Candidatus Omnitrophota bacterium]